LSLAPRRWHFEHVLYLFDMADFGMIKKILQFFTTAPKVKSDKVLKIERDGRINELLDAIERDRKGLQQTGKIKVTRVR
jgi:hypothetical protein